MKSLFDVEALQELKQRMDELRCIIGARGREQPMNEPRSMAAARTQKQEGN